MGDQDRKILRCWDLAVNAFHIVRMTGRGQKTYNLLVQDLYLVTIPRLENPCSVASGY